MSNTADVIIIGAGVHGASLAFHLAQRGVKVTVLEKSLWEQARPAAQVGWSACTTMPQWIRLAWDSFQYFRNWKEMVGGECGFTRTGFIQMVSAEHEDM